MTVSAPPHQSYTIRFFREKPRVGQVFLAYDAALVRRVVRQNYGLEPVPPSLAPEPNGK